MLRTTRLSKLLGEPTICVCAKRVTVSAPPATAEKHAQLARSIFTETSRPLKTRFDIFAFNTGLLNSINPPQLSTMRPHKRRKALSFAIV